MPEGAAAPAAPDVPRARREALRAVRRRLGEVRRAVLTTHVNPDGDGIGSMAALGLRLARRGADVTVVTPTKPPAALQFLLERLPTLHADDPAAADPLRTADAIIVLDTAEPRRLGALAEHATRVGGILLDHHPPVGPPLIEPAVRDPSACATGEIVFDLFTLEGEPPTAAEARALYAAIATDTGSFRFSNTTPRTHAIAARLLEAGVDPEAMFHPLYGGYTRGRLALTRMGLESLEVDARAPVAWIALDHKALARAGARGSDVEGLIEFPRRLVGIEVGMLFRALGKRRTKVSLRSNGTVDVARAARDLGGGGHPKASGVLLEEPLEDAVRLVLDAVRDPARVASEGRSEYSSRVP